MKLKTVFPRYFTVYRVITAAGFIAAAVLVLIFPVKMIGASPWSYYYGVKNFAQGDFVVDDQVHNAQVADARQQGGMLMQYVEIADNKWALEKAPGYVFYLVPFELMGIPRWGNVFLLLGTVIMTYILLKRLRDEKTACIGSLLLLFTPVTLTMTNLAYMDTLASLAFLAMGGGLYFYYHLERGRLSPLTAGVLLFFAFFLVLWSVISRFTNAPAAIILALHYVIIRLMEWRKRPKKTLSTEVIAIVLGAGLPLAAMLIYDYFVFGNPLDYGYNYTRFPINFAFQYLGQVNDRGQSQPLQIILDNLKAAPKALFWGFPLLAIGIPGFILVLYQKFARLCKGSQANGRWSSIRMEISWDLLLMLIGWFLSVFLLYLTYEFTAENLGSDSPLIRFARFYLPGLFPIVIICALVLVRIPFKLYIPVLLAAAAIGAFFYTQYVTEKTSSDSSTPQRQPSGLQQPNRLPPRVTTTNTQP